MKGARNVPLTDSARDTVLELLDSVTSAAASARANLERLGPFRGSDELTQALALIEEDLTAYRGDMKDPSATTVGFVFVVERARTHLASLQEVADVLDRLIARQEKLH